MNLKYLNLALQSIVSQSFKFKINLGNAELKVMADRKGQLGRHRSNFFQFHAIFETKSQTEQLDAPTLWLRVPSGISWIHHKKLPYF